MALQIRIVNPTNPNDVVILENAGNRQYYKSVNSSDEGISFEIPKNDAKASKLNPYDESSFTNLWEVWETSTNKKLNFGPITNIEDSSGGVYKVTGAGRSALLADHFITLKFFYASIDSIIEELRYENIAAAPSTKVLVTSLDEDNLQEEQIFKTILPDETYYALSRRTKDFIIDEQSGYIPLGKIEPPRTFYATNEYWSGMSPQDTIALDFGDVYKISKLRLLFPWWGGPQRTSNRTYEFEVKAATDTPVVYSGVLDRNWGAFTTIFDSWEEFDPLPPGIDPGSIEETMYRDSSTIGNRVVTGASRPFEFYIGYATSGYAGTGYNTFHTNQDQPGPIDARYLTVYVKDVHAWYGNSFDTQASTDGWDYQCDPNYRPGDNSYFGRKLGLMTYKNKAGVIKEKSLPTDKLKPESDCNASIVELGAYQEIIEKKTVKPLAKQRIDNNNKQIEYYRVPDPSELRKVTKNGIHYQKFEPGTFLRKFNVSWTGATNTYYKFFKKDCAECYPDGYSFAILDDQNTPILMTDSASGTQTINSKGGDTKYLITRGVAMGNLTLNWVDAWKGRMNEFSWGGSYSYTEQTGDWFKVHFRGESFKWYATIPAGKTGATVKIEFRQKGSASAWTKTGGKWVPDAWSVWGTLENSYKIPDGLTAEVAYEIPYESGILDPDTIYEIRITLLDDNFCSVDSIEGYWSASVVEYNEDSTRIAVSNLQAMKQIYDKRFSGGSMYKWNKPGVGVSISFEGDRIIIYSAKGRRHGRLTLLLFRYVDGVGEYDPGVDNHVMIPGGDPEDGSLVVNLDTNKRGHEFPGFVLFDSNDYFTNGLPWAKYTMSISYQRSSATKYMTTKYETGSSSFVSRCSSCNPRGGRQVSIYEYVYLDSIIVHELIGLSAQFQDQTHLDVVKSISEAIQVEWDANVDGFRLEPRLGRDTDTVLREGENTLVSYNIVNDIQKVATRLLSNGSDIDGLPMSAIVEDHKTKSLFGRTITRQHDFRDIANYMQLVGLTRMELKRRNKPEKRITVQHVAASLDLEQGDSFILWTKKSGNIRLRINRKQISESGSGRTYELECVQWPQIT